MPSAPFFHRFPSLHFFPSRYRIQGIGDWSGHIPFACDLIASLRPSVFVELGTHQGESYFAFCQAIKESNTRCEAYAVDTWQGDSQTGAYGDEVFEDVDSYNREHYSSFSHLLRMSFDEAESQFSSESIDLLHIDGLHTYEASRHDFDVWWPKVRPGGIVLLHDTGVRKGDFGVWKLLSELRVSFPTAEFFHSSGLGIVLKPGEAPAEGVAALLFSGDEETRTSVRLYYEVCADHLEHKSWLDRQKQAAECDIVSQLFWRSAGDPFTEANSIRSSRTIKSDRTTVSLQIPELATTPAQLRLDITDRPAFLTVHRILVTSSGGAVLRDIEAAASVQELAQVGLRGLVNVDGSGLLLVETPSRSSFFLPLETVLLESLSGGSVVVTLSALSAAAFASDVAITSERRISEQEQALARAEQLISGQASELNNLSEAFRNLEQVAAERLNELGLQNNELAILRSSIQVFETSVAAQNAELVRLRERLTRIEKTIAWRAYRRMTGIGRRVRSLMGGSGLGK